MQKGYTEDMERGTVDRRYETGGEETGDECRATVRYRSGGEEAPLPTHTPRHSTRVEWLEWWKGWLLRSGAFPLWNA